MERERASDVGDSGEAARGHRTSESTAGASAESAATASSRHSRSRSQSHSSAGRHPSSTSAMNAVVECGGRLLNNQPGFEWGRTRRRHRRRRGGKHERSDTDSHSKEEAATEPGERSRSPPSYAVVERHGRLVAPHLGVEWPDRPKHGAYSAQEHDQRKRDWEAKAGGGRRRRAVSAASGNVVMVRRCRQRSADTVARREHSETRVARSDEGITDPFDTSGSSDAAVTTEVSASSDSSTDADGDEPLAMYYRQLGDRFVGIRTPDEFEPGGPMRSLVSQRGSIAFYMCMDTAGGRMHLCMAHHSGGGVRHARVASRLLAPLSNSTVRRRRRVYLVPGHRRLFVTLAQLADYYGTYAYALCTRSAGGGPHCVHIHGALSESSDDDQPEHSDGDSDGQPQHNADE